MLKANKADKKKKQFIKKILACIKAKPISMPSDKEAYFAWLKSPNNHPLKKFIGTWKGNDANEVIKIIKKNKGRF